MSSTEQVSNLNEVQFIYFLPFMDCAFDIMYKKFSLALSPPNFLLCFLKKFYSLWFIPNIIDFDPFWVHFYVSVKFGLRLASLPVVSDCSSTVCWKHSLSPTDACVHLWHTSGERIFVLFLGSILSHWSVSASTRYLGLDHYHWRVSLRSRVIHLPLVFLLKNKPVCFYKSLAWIFIEIALNL